MQLPGFSNPNLDLFTRPEFFNSKNMFYHRVLALIHCLLVVVCIASSTNEPQPAPNELFNSLEELARLVDVAYCVGTTGVQEPFQCLSHCAEFPDLQLLTVSFLGEK
jgi:triacylglycerol lipase